MKLLYAYNPKNAFTQNESREESYKFYKFDLKLIN